MLAVRDVCSKGPAVPSVVPLSTPWRDAASYELKGVDGVDVD